MTEDWIFCAEAARRLGVKSQFLATTICRSLPEGIDLPVVGGRRLFRASQLPQLARWLSERRARCRWMATSREVAAI